MKEDLAEEYRGIMDWRPYAIAEYEDDHALLLSTPFDVREKGEEE